MDCTDRRPKGHVQAATDFGLRTAGFGLRTVGSGLPFSANRDASTNFALRDGVDREERGRRWRHVASCVLQHFEGHPFLPQVCFNANESQRPVGASSRARFGLDRSTPREQAAAGLVSLAGRETVLPGTKPSLVPLGEREPLVKASGSVPTGPLKRETSQERRASSSHYLAGSFGISRDRKDWLSGRAEVVGVG